MGACLFFFFTIIDHLYDKSAPKIFNVSVSYCDITGILEMGLGTLRGYALDWHAKLHNDLATSSSY